MLAQVTNFYEKALFVKPTWQLPRGRAQRLCASRAKVLSTLLVSQLLERVLHALEGNILGPRVYEALFKAALNVVEANAVSS